MGSCCLLWLKQKLLLHRDVAAHRRGVHLDMTGRVFLAVLWLAFAGTVIGADLSATVKDKQGGAVEDAVVLAVPLSGAGMPPAKPADEIVDQIDKEFVPYVKPVMVGSLVHFPNKDNIRHHVYSFSPTKRFALPLYSGSSAPPVLFDKPGVVILGCNVHDWMISYIYVAETPYFGKTGPDGKARIKNLPPGEYMLRVWHPRMEAAEETTTRRIVITSIGMEDVTWQLRLKQEFRIRRAPVPGGGVYR
jgi:plastocyanin